MKSLWLISQDYNTDYDTYDSAVVVAETEEEARMIHPSGREALPKYKWDWAPLDAVTCKYLGVADEDLAPGSVVCASFNAG
jgi:hypothetical protein